MSALQEIYEIVNLLIDKGEIGVNYINNDLIECSYCREPAVYDNKNCLITPTINDIKHHPDCKFKRLKDLFDDMENEYNS